MKRMRIIGKAMVLMAVLVMIGIVQVQGKNTITGISVGTQSGILSYGTGSTATYIITLTCDGQSSAGSATLSLVGTLPNNATSNLSSFNISLPARSTSVTQNFTITSANTTPAGTTNLTVKYGTIVSNTFTFIVNKKTLTLTGASVTPKIYDGSTSATITGGTLQGVISPDVITLTQSGSFIDKNVGSGKDITSNCSISELSASNYSLTQPILKGDITPRPLTLTGSKTYDGNVNVSAAQLTAGNIVNSDGVTLTGTATVSSALVGSYSNFATNNLTSSNTNYSTIGGTVVFNINKPTAVTWNGATSGDWTTASNWTPPYLPDATIDASIPSTSTTPVIANEIQAECMNLTIASNLTIQAKGSLTVTGATTIDVAEGLTILSDVSGTGSLITATASGSGTAKVERYMAPTKWHIVSSPVTGLTVNDFLTDNTSIPFNKTPGYTNQKGMSEYYPVDNVWNDYFDVTNDNGSITPGKGYSMRVKTGETKVSFIGTLNASVPTLTNLIADKWNCIGNPYTSAIRINAADGIANFLDVNASSLDPYFGAIYLWYQADPEVNNVTEGMYESISNVSTSEDLIPAGQAFMVRMREGVQSISFTNAMQVHNTTVALKSTNNVWPTIKLTATAGNITSSTIVAFHEGMTAGLDPTYDAGLLKGGSPVEVYTRLVEDSGIPFDIQALPASYESTVVPVGIDCTQGGQVSFSAELLHVPSACQVLLEDRLNKVFTDLSVNSYTADLMGSTVSQDRFFLHTSNTTTGMDAKGRLQNLRAWAVSNQEIKISGEVSSKAIATLYDLQGRAVSICPLQERNLNGMPLKGLKQGVYLLRVQDNNRVQVLKVNISE